MRATSERVEISVRGTARWVVMLLLAGCPAAGELEDSNAAEQVDSSVPVDTGLPSCDAQPIQFGACARRLNVVAVNAEPFGSVRGVVQAIERSAYLDCGGTTLGDMPAGEEAFDLVLADEDGNPIARVGLSLPWNTLPFVRVGDSIRVERTGENLWLESPAYGTLTLRGADGELLFWLLDHSMIESAPELVVRDGYATCANQGDCASTRRGVVVESGDEMVSVDPGGSADVGEYVVLLGNNTRRDHYCFGFSDRIVAAAVRGSQASLEANE